MVGMHQNNLASCIKGLGWWGLIFEVSLALDVCVNLAVNFGVK